MRPIPVLLAEMEIQDAIASLRSMDPSTLYALIVVGAIALITLLILIWAAFFRSAKRQGRSHHHSHRRSAAPADPPQNDPAREGASSSPQGRRRWRRSRRRHRPRNPTLAETGGLPPIRPDDPPAPQA